MTIPPANSPHSSAPARPPARRRFRKLAKRLLFTLLGLLAIGLIIFLLLPQWISNDQGRAYILQQLNKRMTATLAIDHWSLGWFRGTDLANVSITLPDGTPLLTCPAIHSELTLWSILWGHYDVGTTIADSLQLHLTRYANRSTSLDALLTKPGGAPNHMADALLTLRGSFQAKFAALFFTSQSTRQTLAYTNVNIAIAIGSAEAPFHVQLSATAPDHTLALNATFPALHSWPAQAPSPAAAIAATSDFEISAANLPAALLCDFANLDPRWQESIGPTLTSATLSNHAVPTLSAGRLSINLRGSNGAFIDAAVLLRPSTAASPTLFSLSPSDTEHALASLNVSAPLAGALARLNPLFDELAAGDGPLNISLTTLSFAPADPADTQLAARITFPPLTFRNESLAAQLLTQADPTPMLATRSATLSVTAEPLRLRLADRHYISDPFTLTFNRKHKITFHGAVSLDGTVDLLATLSTTTGALGTATEDLPITGTIEKPVLTIPH